MDAVTNDRAELLFTKDVLAITGWSKSTLFRRLSEGSFARPVKVEGSRLLQWRRADLTKWFDRLKVGRPGEFRKRVKVPPTQMSMA